MGQSFYCLSCGAEIEFPKGAQHNVRCQYCGSNQPVPEEVWKAAEVKLTMNKWGKYLIIFLIITVGVPTCLGLVGAILGIGGSILGILASFLAPFFSGLVLVFVH